MDIDPTLSNEQLNYEVQYSLNIKQNNEKSVLKVVVLVMINKKTDKEFVVSS